MKTFDNIKFNGTFRNYQQRVLDTSKKYLKNNKIHIVAAPGSGKTILGIELIRRLSSPCIVLSPTNTIRYQWGDRFESMFLPKGESLDNYVSFDLKNLQLITSITYQGLHSSINKIVCKDEDGNEIDYSNIDLFKLIKENGIKTICLDEAHHLQNEWQKALEVFIKGIDNDVKVIALTATPPYDATPTEWNRYISTCGEIDEEIFVTELVKCKNLCPHQDYIYLNYPTLEESVIYNKFKESIEHAFIDLEGIKLFTKVPKIILINKKELLCDSQNYINLIALLRKLNIEFDLKQFLRIFNLKEFPNNFTSYENALNFVLKSDKFFNESEKQEIILIFKKYKLVEKNKICITNNSKIDDNLIYSMGKLESIINIVSCEYSNLKNNLRMLILTDYIRKNTTNKINTNELFNEISIVSIFETIRRHNGDIKIGALSGTLVILPTILEKEVKDLLGKNASKLKTTVINNTDYSEYNFSLSNKEKVAIVGKLFEEGKISLIVGTKSLLGEGWDSPCINSLIMASFVGSFMLSNQMRGRAIRVFKNDPNKTANIWHLVTLEPQQTNTENKLACNEENSADYKTLKRRFDCFVGPHYTQKSIESGIDRISVLKNSYTKESIIELNSYMETESKNRELLANKWNIDKSGIMYMQTTVPNSRVPQKLAILNGFFPTLFLLVSFILTCIVLPQKVDFNFIKILLYALSTYIFVLLLKNIIKVLILSIPKLFILKLSIAIKSSLQKFNFISKNSKIKIKTNKNEKAINLILISDNIKEQKMFLDCINEFLSPILDCRYILCNSFWKFYIYKYSFQIPKILSTNKDFAESVQNNLKFIMSTKLIFNSTKNSQAIYWCINKGYLNKNSFEIKQKQVLG